MTNPTPPGQVPEALRLAEILEGDYDPDWLYEVGVDEAAAELRRLHAENERLAALVEAQQPAPSAAAAGFAMVPVDATDAMMAAFAKAAAADVDWHGATEVERQEVRDGFGPAYRAMLAAAPQPSPTPQADSQPAPDCDLFATTDEDLMVIAVVGLNSARFRLNKGDYAGALEVVNKARDACVVAGERASARAVRAPAESVGRDAERLLDWLKDEACDLRCVSVPTGGDDSDVDWIVVEHHMAEPREREIARGYSYDPRDAIRAAMAANGGNSHG